MSGAVYYAVKILLSAVLIAAISGIAKRSTFVAALVASLPIVSILAFIWLYFETRDVEKIASLSTGILWLVIPSLALFVALPALLRHGWNFWLSLGGALALTLVSYFVMLAGLKALEIQI
jgi:hypothetical protein